MKIVQPLARETLGFIVLNLWPANSPDLSPVNYWVWGKLQEQVSSSQIHDVAQLKSRFIEELEYFNQLIINEAVRQ